jgi:hypothetical protein
LFSFDVSPSGFPTLAKQNIDDNAESMRECHHQTRSARNASRSVRAWEQLTPHMALFALMFLVVALILIGVGIVAGFLACCIAAVLLGVGIISSSVVIGLLTRRPVAGEVQVSEDF